jgi:DNA polymerase III epsilon subunit family exonuclease
VNEVISFDFETTGLSSIKNEIIEYSFLKMKDGVVIEKLTNFVKPKELLPPKITEITKITDEMLESALPIKDHIDLISKFIGNTPLVGYNVGFDKKFLNVAFYQHNNHSHFNDLFCAMDLTIKYLNLSYWPKLREAVNLLDLTNKTDGQFHRAESDAYSAGLIYFKVKECMQLKDEAWQSFSFAMKAKIIK